jgi:hypothetical protein
VTLAQRLWYASTMGTADEYIRKLQRDHGYNPENPYAQIPATLWWLSFIDPKLPEGERFIGVCIVGPATSFDHAMRISHAVGCNPGGSVCGHPLDPNDRPRYEAHANRLLSHDELDALGV